MGEKNSVEFFQEQLHKEANGNNCLGKVWGGFYEYQTKSKKERVGVCGGKGEPAGGVMVIR